MKLRREEGRYIATYTNGNEFSYRDLEDIIALLNYWRRASDRGTCLVCESEAYVACDKCEQLVASL